MTPDQTPPNHANRHGLVVGLILTVLLLTLAAAGFLIVSGQGKVSPDEYAAACKAEVQSAVLDGAREITRACADGKDIVTTGTVPSREGAIGFDYPLGWSVSTTTSPTERVTWRASLVPGYFTLCDECDGPFVDISMQMGSLTDPAIAAQPDFNAYLQTIYSQASVFSNIAVSKAADGIGTRYTVTGNLSGMYEGPFETIYYTGATSWASAFYLDRDIEETGANEGWEIVKDSLDFTGIK